MVRAQGTATAEGLRQASELGFLSRLARDATGSAAYNVNLSFRRGTPEIAVTSNLQGLALNLPAPLAKPAEAVLPLRYENALVRESLAAAARRICRTSSRSNSAGWPRWSTCATCPGPSRGCSAAASPSGWRAGESAPLPEQGVMANINLANVNVDAWEAVLGRAAGEGAAAGGGRRRRLLRQPAASPWGYLPTVHRGARQGTHAGRPHPA